MVRSSFDRPTAASEGDDGRESDLRGHNPLTPPRTSPACAMAWPFILPVLVGLTHEQIAGHYPLVADIVTTAFDGDLGRLADEIAAAI